MIFLAFFLLMAPGLITIRLLWSDKINSLDKCDYIFIITDYMIYSFLIILCSYGFMFLTYPARIVLFSTDISAYMLGVSHIGKAGFVLKYGVISLIFSILLPYVISRLIGLISKKKSRLSATGLITVFISMLVDERNYKTRLLFCSIPILLFTFMLFLWGSLESIYRNQYSVNISYREALIILVLTFAVAFIVLTFTIALLKGEYFNILLSLIFSVNFGAYSQLLFMNKGLGLIDGRWVLEFDSGLIINYVVWLLILIFPHVLRYFHKSIWKKVIVFGTLIVFTMQFTVFAGTLPRLLSDEGKATSAEPKWFLSTQNEFVLSEKENTVVFILDGLSNYYITPAFEAFPEIAHELRDFTRFTNSSTLYDGTYPTMSYLLTGQRFDPTIPTREWLDSIWSHPDVHDFYGTLSEENYIFNLFVVPSWITLNRSQLLGIADNFSHGVPSVLNHRSFILEAISLSLFRYSPLALKNRILKTDGTFASSFDGIEYFYDDIDFYKRLLNKGLTTQKNNNVYTFYHLNGLNRGSGAINEFVEYSPDSPYESHVAGAFRIVIEYINQMKKLEIYDNANIIIMADHGDCIWMDAAFLIKRSGSSNEFMQINTAPINHEDYWQTLIDIMALNMNRDFGRSVFDIPENEVRERVLTSWSLHPNISLPGTYNCVVLIPFTNFDYKQPRVLPGSGIHRWRTLDEYFDEQFPHIEVIPLFDSFYGSEWVPLIDRNS